MFLSLTVRKFVPCACVHLEPDHTFLTDLCIFWMILAINRGSVLFPCENACQENFTQCLYCFWLSCADIMYHLLRLCNWIQCVSSHSLLCNLNSVSTCELTSSLMGSQQAALTSPTPAPTPPPPTAAADTCWFSCSNTTCRCGDVVRVDPSVTTPAQGWGYVSHSHIGSISADCSFTSSVYFKVDFPVQWNWMAARSEMQKRQSCSGTVASTRAPTPSPSQVQRVQCYNICYDY